MRPVSLYVVARRGRDLGEARAARALAALEQIAGHRDVVGGRGPAQVDLRGRDRRRGEIGRRRRRGRVGGRGRRGARGVGVAAEVRDGVGRAHAIAVAGIRRAAGVVVRRARRGRDLGEARAARALAALEQIAGHRDVVGGRGPAQVDLRGRDRGGGEIGRRRRRRRVARPRASWRSRCWSSR